MRTRRLPRLTLDDLDDPARLAAKIDQLLLADELLRRGAIRIRRRQGRLSEAVNDEAFRSTCRWRRR